ncbi:MAG: helix-turn-helix domain-containing protein [Desulfobacterales bacterium]
MRKQLIIKAANGTFEEKSFHEIGMRDIAVKAGVSAASIYRYFPSRDDLFVEALIQEHQHY